MGLFSNKKTQADGFSFAVDEVYALKEGKSVVVTGKMTEGKVTPGTAAICLDSEAYKGASDPRDRSYLLK